MSQNALHFASVFDVIQFWSFVFHSSFLSFCFLFFFFSSVFSSRSNRYRWQLISAKRKIAFIFTNIFEFNLLNQFCLSNMSMKFDVQRRLTILKLEDMQDMNKAEQAKIDHKNHAYSEEKLSKRSKMMKSIDFSRSLKLQQIVKNDIRVYQFVNTSTASSWNKYKKRFSLDLDDLVIIANRKHTFNKEKNVVVVKCISSSENSDKLRMINRIQHENFVNYFEFYDFDKSFYLVSQSLVVFLTEIVMCLDYLTEIELAVILEQIRLEKSRYSSKLIAKCSRFLTIYSIF